MTSRLTHIALVVSDMDQSVDFYQDWCDMTIIHERSRNDGGRVVWLSSPDYEGKFVIVLATGRQQIKAQQDAERFEHLGFGTDSLQEVFDKAARAKKEGNLYWDVKDFGDPVGTLCGVLDPDGNIVEFSYGQPISFDAPKPN